jgi:hypothetical protein
VLIITIVFWDEKSYSVVSTHQIKQIRDTSKEDFVSIIIWNFLKGLPTLLKKQLFTPDDYRSLAVTCYPDKM